MGQGLLKGVHEFFYVSLPCKSMGDNIYVAGMVNVASSVQVLWPATSAAVSLSFSNLFIKVFFFLDCGSSADLQLPIFYP